MKCIIDLHTHTIAGGHGYSTLKENIEVAKERGLKVLGLSEHAPSMPGGTHPFFFSNYRCIPRQYGELRLLCGVEANVMDFDGRLDMSEQELSTMDYCIASMHLPCMPRGTREENTNAILKVMQNPYVTIIGHPDDSRYPLDYEKIVKAAKENNVILEVNNSSLNPKSVRAGGRENNILLLNACKKYQVPVMLGTDSHICYTVGDFQDTLQLLKEVDFPEELVWNTEERFLEKLKIRK